MECSERPRSIAEIDYTRGIEPMQEAAQNLLLVLVTLLPIVEGYCLRSNFRVGDNPLGTPMTRERAAGNVPWPVNRPIGAHFIQLVWSLLISARILMRRLESLRRRLRALPLGRERRNISMTC